ncbi:type II secretion system F family protein [Bacteriovorax sp. PP10]|uniref:Type II secretion system F family protein n=1 Tax=Bacteriovorax antarcticus TaxID=3088717 RepID=A0ABU5VNI7_9BACT|nr:type II secretion system F family protein [Bacteriovorax sp. PP10]MEA9354607.1 type II secretion system F family protein [Bacteriovorax sp. PP10]
MSLFLDMVGRNGLIFVVGMMVFFLSYRYSINIFEWVEHQTYGTRTYITEKLEFLFIEIPQDRLTYLLLGSSVGLGFFFLLVIGFFGSWIVGAILGFIMAFIGFKAPRWIVDFLVERRIKAYSLQMVDALQLLSNGVRAGLSVPQAIGMIVEEMPAPISQEFNILLQQNRIGMPLEECFENLAKRVPLEDNDMFVSAVNILRETGGNLAETFDTIVDVIRERVRLQQKVDTFTAQGMFQGMTIGAMPYLLGIVYFLQDPNSITPLFTTPIGLVMLFAAVLFDIAGIYVIMKIVKIKI